MRLPDGRVKPAKQGEAIARRAARAARTAQRARTGALHTFGNLSLARRIAVKSHTKLRTSSKPLIVVAEPCGRLMSSFVSADEAVRQVLASVSEECAAYVPQRYRLVHGTGSQSRSTATNETAQHAGHTTASYASSVGATEPTTMYEVEIIGARRAANGEREVRVSYSAWPDDAYDEWVPEAEIETIAPSTTAKV